MPDVWYPGATRDPGVNAGYQAGRNQMQWTVCHYTVGTDSSAIGQRGYFHFLIGRDGQITQYAEVDAVTWHCGEGNPYGPGIEVEYLPGQDDVVFTEAARDACGQLVHWLNTEWGILLVYHDAQHDTPPGSYTGFLSHRSIIQTESHSDYWPQTDWDLMVVLTPPVPPLPPESEPTMVTIFNGTALFLFNGITAFGLGPPSNIQPLPFPQLPQVNVDRPTWDKWVSAGKIQVV